MTTDNHTHNHTHAAHTTEHAAVDVSTIPTTHTDPNVTVKDVSFHFKKDKTTEIKRPTVELKIPVPSVDGLVAILKAGGKQLDLLLSAAQDVVIGQARSLVNDTPTASQESFDFSKVTWDYIANMPAAERKGGGISKEVWEEFGKDYATVIGAQTKKTPEQIDNAVKLLLAKFTPVKTNKPALEKLREGLGIWYSNTTQAEELKECFEFLDNKADKLLNVSDEDLAANL